MKNSKKGYALFIAIAVGLTTFSCSDYNVSPVSHGGASSNVNSSSVASTGVELTAPLKGSVLLLANQIAANGIYSAYFGPGLQMSVGVTFKTHKNGRITHVGVVNAVIQGRIILRVWDTQSPSAPILVTTLSIGKSTPGASYVQLTTPLNITAEKEYIVSFTNPPGGYTLAPTGSPSFLPRTIGDVTIVNGCSNFFYRSTTKTYSDYPGDGYMLTNQIMGYPDFIFAAQ